MNSSPADGSLSVSRRAFVQAGVAVTLSAASYARVSGANERIGLGFIGYGLIGKRHVLDFQKQPDVDLVAVAETHRGRLNEATELIGGGVKGGDVKGSGVKGYDDFRHLLDNPAVQAVVVSTPDHWHALMTMMACAAGKDVYVEKPTTLFVREGRSMVDVARKHRRVVQVGTQQRSGAHYARAKKLIEEGYLGKITSVRMQNFRNIMPGYGSPPDEDPPRDLDWDLWLGPAPRRKYNRNRALYHFRWFWDYSGGQMTNLGQHSLDIVHWFLGLTGPSAVSSAGGRMNLTDDNGETPDMQDAILEYPGCNVVWSHREACTGPAPRVGLEFCGTKGTMTVSRSGFSVSPDREVPPANTVPQFTGAHPVGGPQRAADTGAGPKFRAKALEDRSGDDRGQFVAHARDFLDCVKSRREPTSDLESGHRVATACHLANISLRIGRKIRWDAKAETIVDDDQAAKMLSREYRTPWDAELKRLISG